jgi:deoxyribonuclease IV
MAVRRKPKKGRSGAARFGFDSDHDLLGAHVSTQGGVTTIFDRGREIGATALAFFSKNNNRWHAKPLSPDEIARFSALWKAGGAAPLVVHSAYLINLAATSEAILERSIAGMADELGRAEALGAHAVVLHPGAHMGAGSAAGIDRIARSLDRVHQMLPGLEVVTLLETSAGQGSCLGCTFEELGAMIRLIDDPGRVGICVDTCHIFAAGYDIRTEEGWNRTIDELDMHVGIDRVAAFHLNDSKRELGSRVDRHQHIGEGEIGLDAFAHILNDPRFAGIPKLLETPKTVPVASDVENLRRLRSLLR